LPKSKKSTPLLVWPMINEDGHCIVFDISTAEKSTNLFKGLIRDVVRNFNHHLKDEGEDLAAKLLEKKVILHNDDDLREFLSDYAEVHFSRDSTPTYADDEWPDGMINSVCGH